MNKGDLLFIEGKKWYSKIIQRVTNSRFSHVAIYIGNGLILESDIGGVQINPLSIYDNHYYSLYRHKDATRDQIENSIEWMLGQVGAGYDYLGILGILISLFTHSRYNLFDIKKNFWCAEVICDGFFFAHISLDVDSNTWTISPGRFSLDPYLYNVGEHDV